MKLIGLTGSIGSGKTTVAGLFQTMGIPVYDSDARAKILMNTNPDLIRGVKELFGPEAYGDDHVLNRKWIASQVFTNPSLLQQLNAIVHPAVGEDLKKWAQEKEQASAPYIIQESAIIFEEELTARFASVILIVAPEELRMQRVMTRDEVTREHVMDRIKNQWLDVQKIPLADYVIFNDGERPLIEQVMDIDTMIRNRQA